MHYSDEHLDVPSLELSRLKAVSALGRGAKGIVFLVQTDNSSELLAFKAISRRMIESRGDGDGSDYRRICFEQEVLKHFDHPLLPRLRGVVETGKIVGYTIDYCPGRDLHSLRKKQTEEMFSDDSIRFYAAELVLALEYLHGLGIVYRDLKPENVLIQENGHLMLVDFDLSTKLAAKSPESLHVAKLASKFVQLKKKKKNTIRRRFFCKSGISPEEVVSPPANSESDAFEKSTSFVGTEEYVAPEVLLGDGHDFAVDWWCLGVLLYEMLYGTTPFRGSNKKETFYRILTKEPDLTGEPTPLRDLIRKLLEKETEKRISPDRIKDHDFFRGVDWDLVLQLARPPFIPSAPNGEDIKGNKGIDVEYFVQEVFKIGGETATATADAVKEADSNFNVF
ncbi:Non-specific serine/threonine protein kinase [Bertholletia excelsa]